MRNIKIFNSPNFVKFAHSVLLFMMFSSCGSAKISNNTNKLANQENSDAIIFLVFKMQQNRDGTNSIALISQTQTAGKMKAESEMTAAPQNYLTIDLLKNNRLYKSIIRVHPLYKHVEYPDDNHQFISKDIEVKEDEFFIRIQKNGVPIEVKISETLKNSPKKELLVLKL